MAEVAADHCADWQGLGVSILHRLVVDTLLEAAEPARRRSTCARSPKCPRG